MKLEADGFFIVFYSNGIRRLYANCMYTKRKEVTIFIVTSSFFFWLLNKDLNLGPPD